MGGSHGGKLLHSRICENTLLLLADTVLVTSAMYNCKALSAFLQDLLCHLCPCQPTLLE